MRALYISFFLCLTASASYADLISDVRSCKAESDSLKRLTCFDAIAVPGPAEASTGPTAPPNPLSKAPVESVSAKMRVQNKDYQRQIYHSRVELAPTFKNTSKKTVVAIAHTLTVTDAFGDKIVDGESKLDIKIPPGKTAASETFYFWDDNPFIQGEPYDKLTGPVSTGTAKATLLVTKVIYSDGSSESF
ncbi:hypothetical protein [Rhizobium leguminosarum]|uniref:Uncharacterized protein n=1 Tax=Rhizobium leguminosarum TaxID=384 RepID=A0A2K9ZFL6_RHILE|nr:hypothetical protein [Rhizobium leguminosarum]AUW46841.1 conserved exported protein of unknown function [Rhizobium leguminosarum]